MTLTVPCHCGIPTPHTCFDRVVASGLSSSGRHRISADMLLHEGSLQQMFWILPKSRRPRLNEEIDAEFIVDPKCLETSPPGTSMEDVWVVDQAVTQSKLGPGAWVWSIGVEAKFSCPVALSVACETYDHDQVVAPVVHPGPSLTAQEAVGHDITLAWH